MSRARSGALFLAVAALFAAAPAAAQNAVALAQAAARSARNGAFDTLVTPEALRALLRLADSTKAAVESTSPRPPARGTAATRPSASRPRQEPAHTTPRADAPATRPTQGTAAVPDVPSAQPEGSAITAMALERRGGRAELRIVATAAAQPTLSEPFRMGERARLFLTFAGATLDVASPVSDTAHTAVAGLDAAQREDGVRIAVEVGAFDGYGLETAGDTTILWLTDPAPAAAVADAEPAAAAAAPSDLQLAAESARAGWRAFRADVAHAAFAVAAFAGSAGGATIDLAKAPAGIVAASVRWIGAHVPFGAIARTAIFVALLVAPTATVLLLFRRRGATRTVAQPAIAERTALPTVVPAIDVASPTRAERKAARAAAREAARAAKAAKPAMPHVTRTTADARLWAAKTLAANGADAADIARQTGLSREAAVLLVRTSRPHTQSLPGGHALAHKDQRFLDRSRVQ